ncbi:type II secretion system secretin GspD [Pelagibaculum spongiae]|uniref:Type II secretion system protein GspD n=1 Tax=Pelagibaculum spongiae TaxID=2080658 RepID=A0A2V1GRI2_9GAMM|nr:type II secretion system secretin GspD [Pelagibaculum spongiae]PVZ67611.1 type II secretion system protein GspD [Pelagibaculum spongiae]
MNSKLLKNCFAAGALALCLAISSPAMAQAGEGWTLNHDNADIRAVIGQVAEITGKNFVIDQRVKGKITVISNTSMGKNDVYQVFLSILRVHGYAAVETGNVIKIIPESGAKQDSVPVLDANSSSSNSSGDNVVTRVLQVNNVAAAQLVPILRPLVPQQGHLAAYPPTNVIIISDRAANIERLTNIIRRIDKASDEQVDVVRLENASAKEVVRVVSDLYKSTNKGSRSKNATPKMVADERTNSILLTGDSSDKLRLKALIAHLDSPLEQSGNTRVIYLNYANAENLVKVLTGVKDSLSNKSSKKKSTANSKEVSILSDESLNALVITAPPALMRSLQDVIRKLDIRRAQVLVEAIIVELDETQADRLGVQWLFDGTPGGSGPVGSISFGGQGSILSLAGNIASGNAAGAASALGEGAGIILGDFNRKGIDFGVLINALKGTGAGNILSTPSLTMLDNEDAEIIVGQNVPFVTGSTTSSTNTNPFTTIQREDIGITLKVTSQINKGNSVRMEIEQEVSSLAPSSTGASDLITNKRSIKTTVLVDNNHTIVLGGLIRDDIRESVSKVPLLGDIPFLGALFRYRSVTTSKSNLMVFIKPTIIRDAETQNGISASKYGYIRQQLLNQKFNDKPSSFNAEELLPAWDGDPLKKKSFVTPEASSKQPEAVNE